MGWLKKAAKQFKRSFKDVGDVVTAPIKSMKPKKPKTITPQSPIATPETLTAQAQTAGQEERKRRITRRGRRGTIFAGRRDLTSARTSAAELRQTL